MIPFLESFAGRYGMQSSTVCADSGYGSEMNYEYMVSNQITPFVKYNMFHAEMKRKRRKNAFLIENMIIEVNHRNNELRALARELLTSDEGLMHRSRRPI